MIVKMIQNLKKPNGVTDRLDMHWEDARNA